MPSFSVAIVSADALTAANRRRLVVVAVPGALGKEQQKLRRPVVRSWTGVATIELVAYLPILRNTHLGWVVGLRAW